jgi:uncharacterized protein
MKPAIFHLAFPVRDLKESRRFYESILGAKTGRVRDKWIDIFLFGGQITLHERPEQLLQPGQHGVRHFGAVVSWDDWEDLAMRLSVMGLQFKSKPTVSRAGTPAEQAKMLLEDPSGNVIEIKAYRDPSSALEIDELDACLSA